MLSWSIFLSSEGKVYHKQSKSQVSRCTANAARSLQTRHTSAHPILHLLLEGISRISREVDTTFDDPGCHNFVTYSELEQMLPRLLGDDTLTITCEVTVTSSFASLATALKKASHSGSAHDTHPKRRTLFRAMIDSSDEEEAPQPPKAKRGKLDSPKRLVQSHEQPSAKGRDGSEEPASEYDEFASEHEEEEEETLLMPRKKGAVNVWQRCAREAVGTEGTYCFNNDNPLIRRDHLRAGLRPQTMGGSLT